MVNRYHGLQLDEGKMENGTHVDHEDDLLAEGHGHNACYDYASEKSLSHADAKLFYHNHQLEQQNLEDTLRASEDQEHAPASSQAMYAQANGLLARSSANSSARLMSTPILDTQSDASQPAAYAGPHQNAADNLSGLIRSESRTRRPVAPVSVSGEAAPPSAAISAEFADIYASVREVLDMRRRFIGVSSQREGDNPKDRDEWETYPPPPEPAWDEVNNSMRINANGHRPTRSRKPGQDIGSDFEMSDLLPVPGASELDFELDEGCVYQVYSSRSSDNRKKMFNIPTIRDYYIALDRILQISSDGPTKSFAWRRLQYLEGKWNLYFLTNEYQETADTKRVPHRDFYNVRKVDTHVHHSSCMNSKHLLRFIKSKMKKCSEEVVLNRDGRLLTLKEVFESINLTAYDLSIDTLDMHAHTDSFHRFDKFNLKYNPIGESRLRTIFLKTDNHIRGRYLAELTKQVIADLESSKYQMVEWRISIYGRSVGEWDKLAAWVIDNKLFSHNVRWLIQVPRLYDVFKDTGSVQNFAEVVRNVWQPLFEVTQNPESHPKLHVFLQRVVGFDSVDDESKPERRLFRKYPSPMDWNTKQNPPYSYWLYFMYANMASLNSWRKRRGFNTFLLRPHCGEAGETDHLASAVLCCHSISHGILLRKTPLFQYIFYLDQIGIAMSPLSNNALFLAYERNPFLQYFKRGLNVSLSTDDPLQLAFTKEPLIEEYAVAAQIYKLNPVDMCELAKNSVVQSGFEHSVKQRWLGADYTLPGATGNNVAKTNVPNIREQFRHDLLMQERLMVSLQATNASSTPAYPGMSFSPVISPRRDRGFTLETQRSAGAENASPALRGKDADHHCGALESAEEDEVPRMPRKPLILSSSHLDGLWGPESRLRSSAGSDIGLSRSSTPQVAGQRDVWVDGAGYAAEGPQPRIFPGMVHERNRRDTLKKMSMHETDGQGDES